MNRILRRRPSPATVIALTALIVAAGGAAYATIPDSGGKIHGCIGKSNGNLRVVESAGDCRTNESALEWNRQGPPGPPGGLTTASAEEGPEISTASTSFVDLGGPTVNVTVPSSGLVAAVVRAEIHGTYQPPDPGGTFAAILGGCVGLFVDSQPFSGLPEGSQVNDLVCERVGIGPGAPPVFRKELIDWFTFEATPGPHTFSLRYRAKCLIADHGCPEADRAFYRNRKLWVTPIG